MICGTLSNPTYVNSAKTGCVSSCTADPGTYVDSVKRFCLKCPAATPWVKADFTGCVLDCSEIIG